MKVIATTCKSCKRSYLNLDGVPNVFCLCKFQTFANGKYTPPMIKPEIDDEEGDDAGYGENWMLSGIRFDEMTRRAVTLEKLGASKRSIILSGNGAGIRVKNMLLEIQHGLSYTPKEIIREKLACGVHDVQRIVWCGASGSISYAALKWCYEQHIDLVVLDDNGTVLSESNSGSTDIQAKRAQYEISSENELEIGRWIILGKVISQYNTYKIMLESQTMRGSATGPKNSYFIMGNLTQVKTVEAFESSLNWLSKEKIPALQNTIGSIMLYEARAANAYFLAWGDIALHWATADRNKIPSHWLTVGGRTSPIGNKSSVQNAVRPAQCILNYAYGILEHMARVALLSVGLDVDVGILHADKTGRNSLVHDFMELFRGYVDAKVLSFLRTEFHKRDFIQMVSGEVQMHPELCRAVAALCSVPMDVLQNHAQILRTMIVNGTNVNKGLLVNADE